MVHKIDSSTAVSVMPTPGAAGTPGWFTDGNPALGIAGTVVTADWLNAQQAEILNVLTAAGITPDKTKQNQLLTAIQTLAGSGSGSGSSSGGRTVLTTSLYIYVDATSGNDTNPGTSAAPLYTLQKAWDMICANYDCAFFDVYIWVRNGYYSAGITSTYKPMNARRVFIAGNSGYAPSAVITVSQGNCFNFTFGGQIWISSLTLQATGSPTGGTGCALRANKGTSIYYDNVRFNSCGTAHLYADSTGQIDALRSDYGAASFEIIGGAPCFAYAENSGSIYLSNSSCTVTNTPNFSTAFVCGYYNSNIVAGSFSYSGTATGVRYLMYFNSVCNTAGGGTGYFPGTGGGTLYTGGQYA
ncbi:hypothetical protein [Paracraurococcus lichenis]|uniref:Uncharacterized protein n=1 Tax=Paracraurococcus lichenis TaxID=3064888 RepID=A0ABT9E4D3_9PROT|nr:hypothetical protein [Paracraurococcus sp. LOR1-02]MDO9711040.1 hypothetical protein [Paracraurococcus sp. LOR1-02]